MTQSFEGPAGGPVAPAAALGLSCLEASCLMAGTLRKELSGQGAGRAERQATAVQTCTCPGGSQGQFFPGSVSLFIKWKVRPHGL